MTRFYCPFFTFGILVGRITAFIKAHETDSSSEVAQIAYRERIWKEDEHVIRVDVGDRVWFPCDSEHDLIVHPTMDCSIEGAFAATSGRRMYNKQSYTFCHWDEGTTTFFTCYDGDSNTDCFEGEWRQVFQFARGVPNKIMNNLVLFQSLCSFV